MSTQDDRTAFENLEANFIALSAPEQDFLIQLAQRLIDSGLGSASDLVHEGDFIRNMTEHDAPSSQTKLSAFAEQRPIKEVSDVVRGGIASLIGHLDTFPADLVVDYLFYLFGEASSPE